MVSNPKNPTNFSRGSVKAHKVHWSADRDELQVLFNIKILTVEEFLENEE